jgi:hypothetical protein
MTQPTCSDCGKGLYKRNSTGRCSPCHRAHIALESRYCSCCRVILSRTCKSGMCLDCFHKSGGYDNFTAEEGSRQLLRAINAYRMKHEPWTLRWTEGA